MLAGAEVVIEAMLLMAMEEADMGDVADVLDWAMAMVARVARMRECMLSIAGVGWAVV
jgi:hypothetical protein